MKTAILSVTIDEKNSVEVRFDGEIALEVPMLWALAIAKEWMIDKIRDDQNVAQAGKQKEEQTEKQVTKSEALGVYLDARNTIEQRLQIIARSSDSQTFRIDPELLSKI